MIVTNCTSIVNQITHKKMELLGSIVVKKLKCSEEVKGLFTVVFRIKLWTIGTVILKKKNNKKNKNATLLKPPKCKDNIMHTFIFLFLFYYWFILYLLIGLIDMDFLWNFYLLNGSRMLSWKLGIKIIFFWKSPLTSKLQIN